MHRIRKRLAPATAIAAAGCAAAAVAAPAASAADGVRLVRPAIARVSPSNHARAIARVRTYTPFTFSSAVYPVVAREASAAGSGDWVRVRLSVRPNGRTGWIPARVTRNVSLPWRIVVNRHRRRASVYRNGGVVRSFPVVVGKRSTPTPLGHFFVVERVRIHTSWAHGLWALATSAHSNVLQEFDGGDGQIAIHARGSLSGRLGSGSSHGCIRVANATAAWLARVIPRGTPIDVVR